MIKSEKVHYFFLAVVVSLEMMIMFGCTAQDTEEQRLPSSSWKPVQYDTKLNGIISGTEIMTADKEHRVVASAEEELGFFDSDGKYTKIGNYKYGSPEVRNEGLVYTDEKREKHIYRFTDGTDSNLGEVDSFKVSRNNFAVSYMKDGVLYLWENGAAEAEIIGSYSDNGQVMFVGDKDKTVFWRTYTKNETTVYMSSAGKTSEINTFGKGKYKSSTAYISVSAGQDYAIVFDNMEVFVVTGFDCYERAELELRAFDSFMYTEKGLPEDDDTAGFHGVYFSCSDNDGTYICYLDEKLNITKVTGNMYRNYKIADGYLYYEDRETNNLLCAKLDHGSVVSCEKVSDKVALIDWKQPGNYLYFMDDITGINSYTDTGNDKNGEFLLGEESYSDYEGTLYVYNPKSGRVKIASDVLCGKSYMMYSGRAGGYESATLDIKVSFDGRKAEFYKASADGIHRDKYCYTAGGKAELIEKESDVRMNVQVEPENMNK